MTICISIVSNRINGEFMCYQRRCIGGALEHIAAELLTCRYPASISNYIFSAVFTCGGGGGGGGSTQKALGSRAPPQTPVGELTALPHTP